MTLELKIVDEDLTTVLLDLNARGQGASTGFEVHTWDMGQVDPETEFISNPAYPGAIQTVRHHGPVDMRLSLQAVSTTYDALRTLVGSLAIQLAEGGIMRYKFDGQTNYRYIEFFSSQLPQLIRGDNEVTQKYIIEQFQDLTGFPLVIRRQPYVFEATRNVLSAASISNGNTGSDLMARSVTVGGDLPALAKVSVKVASATAQVVQLRIGRKSTGDLTEYASSFISYPITSPAGLNATWGRVHRKVLTPSDATALEGTYRVFASLKLDAEDVYHVQLRWGTIDEEPAGNVNEDIILDSADTSAMNNFADINLGTVRFDRSGSSLVLEIWGRRETSGTDIDWEDVWLQPIEEEQLRATAPGFRWGGYGREVYTGNELTRVGGAGLDEDDRAVLDDADEYCETADTVLPVGMHLVSFIGTVLNNARIREQVGKLEVLTNDVADSDHRVKLTSRRKYTRIHYDHDNPKQIAWEVTDDSVEYKWRVTQTVTSDDNRQIRVARLIHSYIPVVANNRQFVIDGIDRETYIADSSGSRYFPLNVAGPFLTLVPGVNVLVFRMGEASVRSVYREVDARGRLAENHPTRTATVTIDVRERFIV